MIRSWRFRLCSGAAQPAFGDVLTAAVLSTPNIRNIILPVADTTLWRQGDILIVNPLNSPTLLQVIKLIDSTHLLTMMQGDIGSVFMPAGGFANASPIVLAIACYGVHFRTLTGTVGVYLGTDATVTNAGLGSAFEDLVGQDRYDYQNQNGQNPLNTSEIWMAGGTSDKVGISADIM